MAIKRWDSRPDLVCRGVDGKEYSVKEKIAIVAVPTRGDTQGEVEGRSQIYYRVPGDVEWLEKGRYRITNEDGSTIEVTCDDPDAP